MGHKARQAQGEAGFARRSMACDVAAVPSANQSGIAQRPGLDLCYFHVMSLDVVDLRNFYAQRLGDVARRFVGRGIRARFADTRGLRVVGIGYPTPYLGLFREEAERCLAFMPAPQGVIRWPSCGRRWWRSPTSLPCRSPMRRSTGCSWYTRWRCRRRPMPCCARSGGYWPRRPAARGGAQPARSVGPHGHDALRPRPPLFALADRCSSARDLVHPHRLERGPLCAADRARRVLRSAAAWERAGSTISAPFAGVHIVEASQAGLPRHSGAARTPAAVPALEPVLAPSPGGCQSTGTQSTSKVSRRAHSLPRVSSHRRRRRSSPRRKSRGAAPRCRRRRRCNGNRSP